MSSTSHEVMQTVNCENTVSIPELDVQGVVEHISQFRDEIVIYDNKHLYRVKETDNGNEVGYRHDHGPDEYEQVASDVTLELVGRTLRT